MHHPANHECESRNSGAIHLTANDFWAKTVHRNKTKNLFIHNDDLSGFALSRKQELAVAFVAAGT